VPTPIPAFADALQSLQARYIDAQQGFALHPKGGYRADATAWAILALTAWEGDSARTNAARQRLAQDQKPDGRVPLSTQHPEAFWPTALSILAWQHDPNRESSLKRARQFLLETSGTHRRRLAGEPVGHDPALRGWPWIDRTHSWVEPTALALMALKTEGYREHERVREAVAMLLDRQLPKGGWNCGNTIVFGRELHPYLHSSGMALTALAGLASLSEVGKTLTYLKAALPEVRTPLSLGWGVLGLTAWGERPPDSLAWIQESLSRQKRYGPYNTCWLSLLLVAAAPLGQEAIFSRPGRVKQAGVQGMLTN